MSEVPTIAGVEAWPLDEMDWGNCRHEVHERLRQREEIIADGLGITLHCGTDVLFARVGNTVEHWRELVQWLRDRDAG